MATFAVAIPVILAHEGGYVNNPADPGGETNFGITKRDHPAEDIRGMTPTRAAEIYLAEFWNPYRLGEVVDENVATKLLDMAVNLGPRTMIRLLQRALNFLTPGRPVAVDGLIGNGTLAAVNAIQPAADLLQTLRAYHALRYIELVEQPDNRFDQFAKGWLRRAMA